MDINPTSHTPSPTLLTNSKPTTKKLKVTYLMIILLSNPATAHPNLVNPNSISPNPNQIKTGNLQIGNHGIESRECDQYFYALTSPIYSAQLFFLDAAYSIGITKFDSSIFMDSLRRLHANCKPKVG